MIETIVVVIILGLVSWGYEGWRKAGLYQMEIERLKFERDDPAGYMRSYLVRLGFNPEDDRELFESVSKRMKEGKSDSKSAS